MPLPAPISAAAHRATSSVNAMGRTIGLYIVLALIGLLGVGFLIAALYIWLSEIGTPLQAALTLGIGFLAISAIWLAVLAIQGRERRRRRKEAAAEAAVMASSLSLANTLFRAVSRGRSPFLVPGLILLGGFYLLRSGRSSRRP